MAKCWKCGKNGLFLQLSSAGLCISCLEEASDMAVSLIAKLQGSREERKRFCDLLDKQEDDAVIEKAIVSPFGNWDINIHKADGQYARMVRSKAVKLMGVDTVKLEAIALGSSGSSYNVTANSCTCGDFINRHMPCKHIYRLSVECKKADFGQLL